MKYLSFTIHRYKGVENPITVKLSKSSLVPIIGVNECGKTTILEGILAFDNYNDDNYDGRHIQNTYNRYKTDVKDSLVSAEVQIDKPYLVKRLNQYYEGIASSVDETDDEKIEENSQLIQYWNGVVKKIKNKQSIRIYRNLTTLKYSLKDDEPDDYEQKLCKLIVRFCPFTLYFDDFRDEFDGYVKIQNTEEDDNVEDSLWYKIVNDLFRQTNETFSIKNYLDNSQVRENILSDVEDYLNDIITERWINFSIEKGTAPYVEIKEKNDNHLGFRIIEEIQQRGRSKKRYFKIKERSKGFYWFFNFIMKLEFNPSKRYYKDSDTIYLLDEPGSYLHSSAQKNLLLALQKLARNNKVIFTTHTPFLLDPNKIKLNDIRIATKSDSMEIELYNIATVPKKIHGKNSPFQILMHYLEITPLSYNYSKSNVVIVEGIIDYYAFEMFKEGREMSFFPSHNADSTVFHISYMIADSKNYSVLWDNDTNGIEGYKKAKKSFGEVEARKWMFLPIDKGNKRILQDLFDSKDLSFIKTELDMKGSSFDKTITVLYHSKAKNTILKKLKGQTKSNFDEIFKRLEAILK